MSGLTTIHEKNQYLPLLTAASPLSELIVHVNIGLLQLPQGERGSGLALVLSLQTKNTNVAHESQFDILRKPLWPLWPHWYR